MEKLQELKQQALSKEQQHTTIRDGADAKVATGSSAPAEDKHSAEVKSLPKAKAKIKAKARVKPKAKPKSTINATPKPAEATVSAEVAGGATEQTDAKLAATA